MLEKSLALSLLGSVAACSSVDAPATATTTHAPTDPRLAVLDRMRTAMETRNVDALVALYRDDAVIEAVGGPTLRGRAAIADGIRDEMAPAATLRVAFPRVWLAGDVAIVEMTFRATHPAGSGLHDIGATVADVLWFDRDHRITHEKLYQEQSSLDAQATGEADAPPVPELPATTEVHVATTSDPAVVAWANALEAKFSTDDSAALATLGEGAQWDCVLGSHTKSRAEFGKPLAHFREVFPDERYTANQVWPVEDFVIVDETMTGTMTKDFGGMTATNKPISWHWLEIWQVKDRSITHGWSFTNFNELQDQIAPSTDKPKHRPACSVAS